MTERYSVSDGVIWEDIVGYARAVQIANVIEVSGTTATEGERVIGKGDAYLQAKYIFEKIEKALKKLNALLSDVIRTRMYVTDISTWKQVAKAHQEYFGNIKPATTMVEVSKLIHPDLLVEIEATAIISEHRY